ncbi:MAG: bifunctional oligoribonuclease/PAP phosphatase NrnA [Ruminococcaceae bacterium]|jgi:phosphoesterase RecJ-like protein|nr:bifunctional oligoribonuclease/PAP phosphatase NrnA [Oscillospiraceae bacterium]
MTIDVKKAAELLKENDNIILISHQHPDGDTLGCAFALFYALKKLNKKVHFECQNEIPKKFRFLCNGLVNDEFENGFVVSVDVADRKLLGEDIDKKYGEKIDLAIDHHLSHRSFSPFLLLEERAAACEIVFSVIEQLGVEIDRKIANCLYVGISTDTGCFRYTNTTAHTHLCAAKLIELGAENGKINTLLFETKTKTYAALEKLALSNLELYFDGKCALMSVTKEMFRESGSDETECDGISALPRQIEGVLAGVTIREKGENEYKVSVRTNDPIDACEICSKLGGGGHIRASGCTVYGTLEEAKKIILDTVKESL